MRPLAALGAAALVFTLAGPGAARTDSGGPRPYVVVFTGVSGVPASASQLVADAGGTVTATLPQLGAVRVSSTRPDFAAALATTQVAAVGPDAVRRLLPLSDDGGSGAPVGPATALPGGDPLSSQQAEISDGGGKDYRELRDEQDGGKNNRCLPRGAQHQ